MKRNIIFKSGLLNQTLKSQQQWQQGQQVWKTFVNVNSYRRNLVTLSAVKRNENCQVPLRAHTNVKLNRHLSTLTGTSSKTYSGQIEDDEHLWVRSPSKDIETVVGKTMAEAIWENALEFGNASAIECSVTGRKYSFNEIYRYSRGFAASLIKTGMKRGEVVGLVLPNIPEYPICLMGSWDAGCIPSPVNPAYTPEEITRQLIISETKIVVTIEFFLPAVLSAKKSCPKLENIIVIGKSIPEGCLSFFDLIKTDPTGYSVDFLRGSEIDTKETIALLPFSSGTTGPPKGVMLTHSNITTNARQYIQPETSIVSKPNETPTKEQERVIGILPFFHSYGMSAVMVASLIQGAHVTCIPRFEPKSFLETLKKHRPTVMHLVTPLISFLTHNPEYGKDDLEAVHSILGAAAPIGSVLIHKLLDKAGKYIFFQEGYGMTELSPLSHALQKKMKHTKIGSCGSAVPSTLCKVIDISTGKTLGPNERGELLIRGPQVMKGYFKNEKATEETIDADGWLHTGDICYYDTDAHFYIVDRLKELIKVKGFQVAPSELEDILRDHPQISDVAVIGVPNEEWGELPRAYVVKRDPQLSEEDINNYLHDKIAAYKRLRGGIEFLSEIPKAPSGKILRRELVAAYRKKFGIAT